MLSAQGGEGGLQIVNSHLVKQTLRAVARRILPRSAWAYWFGGDCNFSAAGDSRVHMDGHFSDHSHGLGEFFSDVFTQFSEIGQ
eukprot:2719536-Pyramimonas_sp.AAC.1